MPESPSLQETEPMFRYKADKTSSRKAFKRRAGKTHRKNLMTHTRGGIRL